ncbi:hypothetical protein TFKS16_1992 [Tannerella forsythia KS16]|uniref:Uncharacterized protein n=1 Tax=Tannerella forsythia (strain ATCC 43037 / JCM 10827 / CCUG 21028 A / KCTC 5666 / FDC 338) TaxID=203275 RepID=G8UJA2_TANFA|nr:hypothetical protein BFO_2228 [Tannerella forsythia 92A2]BAR49502.1 hypothetical protein TF3313_2036 [Tannerella forsythia 3313]BAR52207.1 hypothetical protein TFKS16_1992 [Tannerella forsythia KS16]
MGRKRVEKVNLMIAIDEKNLISIIALMGFGVFNWMRR